MALAKIDARCSLHLGWYLGWADVFACSFAVIALNFLAKAVQ
jgi:hypothetical protein